MDVALPGMLHGKLLRSPHAHARLVSVDASRARALPGVEAVLTGPIVEAVYRQRVTVVPHPVLGSPLILPHGL